MLGVFQRIQRSLAQVPRRRLVVGASILCVLALISIGALYLFIGDFAPPPKQLLTLYFGDAMALTGFTLLPEQGARGGQEFEVLLAWRARNRIRKRYVIQVQVVDERGHLWADHVDEPANGKAHTDRWLIGQQIIDTHILDLPSSMPAGDYEVTVAAYDPDVDWNVPVRDAAERMIFDAPVIAHLHVDKNKSNESEDHLRVEQPQRLEMGDLTLLGFIPNPFVRVSRGEKLHIGVFWRARVKPSSDYYITIQLRDALGTSLYENTSRPASDTYPTTNWDSGEVLLDWHDFPIPITLPADPYQMFLVLSDANTQQVVGETKIMNFSVTR